MWSLSGSSEQGVDAATARLNDEGWGVGYTVRPVYANEVKRQGNRSHVQAQTKEIGISQSANRGYVRTAPSADQTKENGTGGCPAGPGPGGPRNSPATHR